MNYFEKIAQKYTPKSCKVSYTKHGSLHGAAWYELNKILVPRPTGRKALYLYLHECAHIKLKHNAPRDTWQEELEAELWAHKVMKKENISVPWCMTARAINYVHFKARPHLKRILSDIDNLTPIDKKLLKFINKPKD
jgi:hypothetical protein